MSTESRKTSPKSTKKDDKKEKSTLSGPKGGIRPKVVTILFALIKMSGIGITEASGKLGGNVFSRTKGGAVIRNRVVGTNPQTDAQQAVRAIFGAISSAWRSLSQEARDAWNAITEDYPYQNRLGETKIPSGKALFQRLNNNLLYAGESLLESPLSPEGVNAPIEINPFSMLVDAGVLDAFTIDVALASAGDNSTIVVFEMTPPLSPGIKNATPRFVRVAQTTASGSAAGIATPSQYTDIFGEPPVGSQVQVRVFSVNPNTGEKSTYFKATTIVASV